MFTDRNSKKSKALLLAFEKGYRITNEGKILNPEGKEINGRVDSGYRVLSIKLDGKPIQVKVHRLLAYQKFGERIFEEGQLIRHLNSNSLDNTWDNIGIGTHKDNMNDIPEEIRLKTALYASSFIKKHNYDEIKAYYDEVKNYKKVMQKFSISSKGTLNYILNSKY